MVLSQIQSSSRSSVRKEHLTARSVCLSLCRFFFYELGTSPEAGTLLDHIVATDRKCCATMGMEVTTGSQQWRRITNIAVNDLGYYCCQWYHCCMSPSSSKGGTSPQCIWAIKQHADVITRNVDWRTPLKFEHTAQITTLQPFHVQILSSGVCSQIPSTILFACSRNTKIHAYSSLKGPVYLNKRIVVNLYFILFCFILTTEGMSDSTGQCPGRLRLPCFILFLQVAGSLYWKLDDSGGRNVICYKVSVRVVYGSKLVDSLHS